MKKVANSRFAIKSWDEKPYSEGQDLPKMTRAAVTKTFTGDIEGEGHVEYLMMYGSDGSATFVGLERIVGQVAGKEASLQDASSEPTLVSCPRDKPRQNLVYTSGYFVRLIQLAQSLTYQCLYVPDESRLTIHMCNGDFGEL